MILVTGANGFIGAAVVRGLIDENPSRRVLVAARQAIDHRPNETLFHLIKDIGPNTDWTLALESVSAVIHCAARAHLMGGSSKNQSTDYRTVNEYGTLNLAQQAASKGVKRFIFISSIGVNGAETFEKPFSAFDKASPNTPYSRSKYEAEIGLKKLAVETGMEVVIVRPPLVYGPRAPGNFGLLVRCLSYGIPLPLGAINNRRSFVGLDNLVNFISVCLTHPAASNQTFLVSDDEDISTAELLRRMARAMGVSSRLIPFPADWLKSSMEFLGNRELAQRLCGSLQIDIGKARNELGWTPPITLNQGLIRAVGCLNS